VIPVEQQEPYGCLRACVASILELAYDDVPGSLAVEENQTTSFLRFMASRGFSIADYSLYAAAGLPDEPQQRSPRTWPTFWIASVLSPRLVDPDGQPGWHTVVMKNGELVWDPHSQRAQGHGGFVHAHVPYVIDPARVIVRVIP
jgi:hypothetical protein